MATYLADNEPVFGVAINGDVRAYPYRIMDWHEMLNDTVGGVAVSLAYCTLCGSGILFATKVEGFVKPMQFGSSGLLYRSNKLMFDYATQSLWNQFTGQPAAGKLTHSNIQLKTLPLATTTWGEWRHRHPGTRVLAPNTGFKLDYQPGKPYGKYFKSSKLMFPVAVGSADHKPKMQPKDEVFVLRLGHTQKAWPLREFSGGKVINDIAGAVPLVLIGHANSRTVRAYRRENQTFEKGAGEQVDIVRLTSKAQSWKVTEAALIGPDGRALSRLPGHIAYWFAWQNYYGKGSNNQAIQKKASATGR